MHGTERAVKIGVCMQGGIHPDNNIASWTCGQFVNISLYTGFRVVLLPLVWHRKVKFVGDPVRDAAT